MLPQSTSPTAKTPGMLVSKNSGLRVHYYEPFTRQGRLDHFETPREHHEHRHTIARLLKNLALFGSDLVSVRNQSRDLFGRKTRKHLRATASIR